MCRLVCILVFTAVATAGSGAVFAQSAASVDREAMYQKYLDFRSYVKGGKVEPHWMADENRFWYAEETSEGTVIWTVDSQRRDKTRLINVNRLRQALTDVLGEQVPAQGIPFDTFDFTDESETSVRFRLRQRVFELDLNTYSITSKQSPLQFRPVLLKAASKLGISRETLPGLQLELKQRGMSTEVLLGALQVVTRHISQAQDPDDEQKHLGLSSQALAKMSPGEILAELQQAVRELRSNDRRAHVVRTSPDGGWEISIRNHNLWARSVLGDREQQLTTDGSERLAYDIEGIQDSSWSADNSRLVARRYDLRSVSSDNLPIAKIAMRPRSVLPPDSLGIFTELFIIDIKTRKQIPVDLGEPSFWKIHIVGWHQSDLFFYRMRSYERLDFMAVSAAGKVRSIVSEIAMAGVDDLKERVTFIDGQTFIWQSERDGANHLYLYDLQGSLIRRLTHGTFPVDRVMSVDGDEGWVYFTAHGEQEHAYRKQLYRVSVRGEGFRRLAVNVAEIQFSPSKKYFVVNQSTPAQPSIVEFRKADGTRIMEVSRVDLDVLRDLQWSPPEVFTFKDADGKSDLFGLFYKPFDFNPDKKYPVIDSIYGGHQMRTRYTTFQPEWGMYVYEQALAQLGYIVVVMDGRGFAERMVRDHVAGIKELAKQHSYIDLSRVGIFGVSAGGNSTLWAMLTAPDVFQVGVATEFSVGRGRVEDDRVLKLGGNLKGKLLLVHGDPHREDAERIARELIHANKFFDVLPIPGANHSLRGRERDYHRYWYEAMLRYFKEHLK